MKVMPFWQWHCNWCRCSMSRSDA